MSEVLELGDGWEEIDAGVIVNRSMGYKIVVAERKLYDLQGNFIRDLDVNEDGS